MATRMLREGQRVSDPEGPVPSRHRETMGTCLYFTVIPLRRTSEREVVCVTWWLVIGGEIPVKSDGNDGISVWVELRSSVSWRPGYNKLRSPQYVVEYEWGIIWQVTDKGVKDISDQFERDAQNFIRTWCYRQKRITNKKKHEEHMHKV